MTDRYEIIKLIGKDPAGGVYLAEDSMLGRKVMFRHIDTEPDDDRPKSWAKEMSSYAGKLCTFQHPNIVTIYDAPVDEDGVSMVTQYVEGETLAERLQVGPLMEIAVHRMASDLLDALHAAHDAGVYHGALHTGSIIRLPRASGGHRYIILDIGLNTLATMVKGRDVHIADPVLLAPELHSEDSEPDESADLFMVGQLCYTAMAGGHPFSGKSAEDAAEAHLAGELPPLREYAPDMQEDFEAWVMKMSCGDRAGRPASIKEATDELNKIIIQEPEQPVPVAKVLPVAKVVPIVAEPVRVAKPVLVAQQNVPVAQQNVPVAKQNVPVAQQNVPVAQQNVPVAKPVSATAPQAIPVATLPMAGTGAGTGTGVATGPLGTQAMAGTGDFLATADDSNKKMMIMIASLVGLVVIGLGLYFVLRSGGDDEGEKKQLSTSELPLPPEGAKVHLHEVVIIGSEEDMGLVKLDGEKTLDWAVFTGARVSDKIERKPEGSYRINPSKIGKFSEVARKGIPVFFETGGKKLKPMAATSAKAGKAKAGHGWNILLRTPKQHQGPMIISLYVFQEWCGFDVEVETPGKKLAFKVPKQDPGVLCIPIEIPKPKKGGFYNINITAAKDTTGEFAMGLNAVHIEGR